MSTALEVFSFPATGQEIRTVVRDGEPWFVAADVTDALGFSRSRDAVRMVDDEDKGAHFLRTPGGVQQIQIINESGLYSLILRSNRPDAKAFKRWVTHEVLPSIRRTGGYEVAPAHRLPQSFAEALQLAADQAREIEQQREQLAVAAPKAEYVDAFVQADDVTTIRVFAGQLGVGETALRGYLVARGVLYRRLVGHYWSRSKQKKVPEYEWLARSRYAPWFIAKDQPQAPRMHNGQLRTTLYVTPRGKAGIRAMVARRPIVGQDDLDMGEAS